MATIKCTVSNCTYWRQTNNCGAEQILVTSSRSPLAALERHGAGAERLQQTPIQAREDSLCYTFDTKER